MTGAQGQKLAGMMFDGLITRLRNRAATIESQTRHGNYTFGSKSDADLMTDAADQIRKLMQAMERQVPAQARPDPAGLEEVALVLGDHFGLHRWADMAEDRADLRVKVRENHRGIAPYDSNEATKEDCREAARAILALLPSVDAERAKERARCIRIAMEQARILAWDQKSRCTAEAIAAEIAAGSVE